MSSPCLWDRDPSRPCAAAVRLGVLAGVFSWLSLCPTGARAQVQLDRFYPPVVSAGDQTVIKAEGKFAKWPVQSMCDRDDVQITLSETSGEVNVDVPADAAPGVAWIRLWDEKSTSKLTPLLIEPVSTIAENEPNNKTSEATAAPLPAVVYGKLEKSNDVDTYRVQLRKGQTFVASVTAHRVLRSPMDAVLQLVDPRGNVILQSDDDRGLDPQLIYQADRDSELLLRIFDFPETPTSTIGYAGGPSFVYTIRLTSDTFLDHALPLMVPHGDSQEAITTVYGWNLPPKFDLRHKQRT